MKVLVTGHKGFLGKYVTQELEVQKHEWVGFDLPENNLLKSDFSILKDVDAVIHLAAMKGIPACDTDPVGAVENNIVGTTRLVEACSKAGIKKFVYASTWAVNSRHKKMYDVTKKACEEIIMHYIKRKDFPGVLLRMATFYGTGMASDGCINQFIKAKQDKKVADIYGDGWEIRQFTHVTDIARGVLTALTQCATSEIPYTVTAKEVISINELAKKIGVKAAYFENGESENYEVLFADELESYGWKQEVSLEEGLKDMEKQ